MPFPSPNAPSFFAPTLSFAIAFQTYLLTVSPTIPGGDSGELIAEGCQLGQAHPPGYPLYTIITYVLTNVVPLPFTPAYTMNVFCAFCGAMTTGILCYIILLLTPPTTTPPTDTPTTSIPAFSALFCSLLFAFSPLSWLYHVTSEVFALNNFLTTLTLLIFLLYAQKPTTNKILGGAFIAGLSLTNQHTSILLSFPAILYIIYTSSLLTLPKLPTLLLAGLTTAAALSLYLYLPISATLKPHAGSWGDVLSVTGFIDHFRRADYGTFQLYSGDTSNTENLTARLVIYATDFATTQTPPFFAILPIVAMLSMPFDLLHKPPVGRKKSPVPPSAISSSKASNALGLLTLLLVALLIFYLVVFHTLANLPLHNPLLFGVHARFWMQPNVIMFALAGVGLNKLVGMVEKQVGISAKFGVYGIQVLLCCVLLHRLSITFPAMNQSDNVFFKGYATSILESLPQNSLLLINYDQQWTSIRYFQECEGVRPDVTSINLSMMSYLWWDTKHGNYPHMVFPGRNYVMPMSEGKRDGGFTFYELLRENEKNFPGGIYMGGKVNYGETDFQEEYDTVPFGLVTRLTKLEEMKGGGAWAIDNKWIGGQKEIWKTMTSKTLTTLPDLDKYKDDTWEWTIHREYFDHLSDFASFVLDSVTGDSNRLVGQDRMDALVLVAGIMEFSIKHDQHTNDRSHATWKNLGLAYMNMIREQGGEEFRAGVFADFLEFEGKDGLVLLEGGWVPVGSVGADWKTFVTTRWAEAWKKFLTMEGANTDPSYPNIKNILDHVFSAAGKK